LTTPIEGKRANKLQQSAEAARLKDAAALTSTTKRQIGNALVFLQPAITPRIATLNIPTGGADDKRMQNLIDAPQQRVRP
jgi:hypothetical protein